VFAARGRDPVFCGPDYQNWANNNISFTLLERRRELPYDGVFLCASFDQDA